MLEDTLIGSEELNEICEDTVCQLHGSKHRSVSVLHYHLLCAKKQKIEESHLLSPSKVCVLDLTLRWN